MSASPHSTPTVCFAGHRPYGGLSTLTTRRPDVGWGAENIYLPLRPLTTGCKQWLCLGKLKSVLWQFDGSLKTCSPLEREGPSQGLRDPMEIPVWFHTLFFRLLAPMEARADRRSAPASGSKWHCLPAGGRSPTGYWYSRGHRDSGGWRLPVVPP